jgi:hypothetical protein
MGNYEGFTIFALYLLLPGKLGFLLSLETNNVKKYGLFKMTLFYFAMKQVINIGGFSKQDDFYQVTNHLSELL